MAIREIREQLTAAQTRLHAIHKGAEAENRDLNEAERKEWDELVKQSEALREREKRQIVIDAEERAAARREPGAQLGTQTSDPAKEWRDWGEFLQAVRWNPTDPRLLYRKVEGDPEKRVLSMGVGAAGGFMVPDQFRATLLQVGPQAAIVRPRATVIPPGDPPDAAIDIPALDQSAARGVYSGVTVTWIGEGVLKPESEPQFLNVRLQPNEVAAHTIVTDKLLRNSDAAASVVSTLLRRAIVAAEDQDFLTGPGGARPQGVIGAGGTVNVVRAGAGAVAYNDIVNMYARVLMGGALVWVGSPTLLPQLMTMVDAGGNLVWQPNAREGAPGTLLGIPFLINQRSPVLGATGDLLLADWNYYLIKDGSGPFVAASEHVLFRNNQTVIKAFWNVDGEPWLTTPLLLEDGVTTMSPFVALQ
jgi:HK97 family phage major capsid protein